MTVPLYLQVIRQKVEEEGSQSLQEPVTGPMICDAVARQMQVLARITSPHLITRRSNNPSSSRIIQTPGATRSASLHSSTDVLYEPVSTKIILAMLGCCGDV